MVAHKGAITEGRVSGLSGLVQTRLLLTQHLFAGAARVPMSFGQIARAVIQNTADPQNSKRTFAAVILGPNDLD